MANDKEVRQRYLALRQGLYERPCEIGSLEQFVFLARRAKSASQGKRFLPFTLSSWYSSEYRSTP